MNEIAEKSAASFDDGSEEDCRKAEALLADLQEQESHGPLLRIIENWDEMVGTFKTNELRIHRQDTQGPDLENHHRLSSLLVSLGKTLKQIICPDGIDRDWPILTQINANLWFLQHNTERGDADCSPEDEESMTNLISSDAA